MSNVSETIKGTVQILAQGRADFWRTSIKAMGLDQGQEDNSKRGGWGDKQEQKVGEPREADKQSTFHFLSLR